MTSLAALAEICIIKSLELAEAVDLAPVHYSLLIWGTIYGYIIFGDLPDSWTWLGVIIIILSGLYSISREKKKVKKGENFFGGLLICDPSQPFRSSP